MRDPLEDHSRGGGLVILLMTQRGLLFLGIDGSKVDPQETEEASDNLAKVAAVDAALLWCHAFENSLNPKAHIVIFSNSDLAIGTNAGTYNTSGRNGGGHLERGVILPASLNASALNSPMSGGTTATHGMSSPTSPPSMSSRKNYALPKTPDVVVPSAEWYKTPDVLAYMHPPHDTYDPNPLGMPPPPVHTMTGGIALVRTFRIATMSVLTLRSPTSQDDPGELGRPALLRRQAR